MRAEREVRFLEINKPDLLAKLRALGASDLGEHLLEEVIVYDPELKWLEQKRFIRLRRRGEEIKLTYKEHPHEPGLMAHEIEFALPTLEPMIELLEKVGLVAYRRQEKRRHSWRLGESVLDIDTWPRVPSYLEIEGSSESALKQVAVDLGFDWRQAVFEDARLILEQRYQIPVGTLRWFTFERVE